MFKNTGKKRLRGFLKPRLKICDAASVISFDINLLKTYVYFKEYLM